ncbi:MAG: response regulator [Promethearchaeota archaeon]
MHLTSKKTISVLIIEDNPGDARLIKEMLKEATQFDINLIEYSTLSNGLEELIKNEIEVILLDLNLPDCSGLNTISIIHEKVKNIPIIILTGRDDELLAIQSLKLGMQDYLVKGKIDPTLLERSILYAIERQKVKQELELSKKEIQEEYQRTNFYKDIFVHDMSNILQGILSVAQLCKIQLMNLDATNDIVDFVGIIENQIIRGSKLISNVGKLSELEESEIKIEPIEIITLLKTSIDDLKNAYQTHNIHVKIDTDQNIIHVQGNDLLLDVFENILINAINHNENLNVEILIKISEEDLNDISYIKLEFIDNGIGIEASRKDLIFTRGTKENNFSGGMGIGLSLVKRILNSCKGEIRVEDRFKGDHTKGSNFIILIPK